MTDFQNNAGGLNTNLTNSDRNASPLNTSLTRLNAASSGPIFNADNGHYYEFVEVAEGIDWQEAVDQAASRSYQGRQGYLVTATTEAEQNFIVSNFLSGDGASNIWLGGSDAGDEGNWTWRTGPEAGQAFWSGDGSGNPVNSFYANWNRTFNEPNNDAGNGNKLMMIGDPNAPGLADGLERGEWNDLPATGAELPAEVAAAYLPRGFVVEYGGLPGDVVTRTNELYWQNSNSGQNAFWEITSSTDNSNQLEVNLANSNIFANKDADWVMEAVADFNGDGQSDAFFHNKATGATEVLTLSKDGSGAITVAATNPIYTIGEAGWEVAGVADFDGNGSADVIWRNQTTGDNGVWMMESTGNSVSLGSAHFINSDAGAEWNIQHVADINNNGNYEFIWLNSTTGQAAVWEMNYNNSATAAASATATTAVGAANNPFSRANAYTVGGAQGTDSQLAAVADFTGDDILDFVWYNDATSTGTIWEMTGGNQATIANSYSVSVPGIGSGWEVAGITPLNFDETPDLILRNSGTGFNFGATVNYDSSNASNPFDIGSAAQFSGVISTTSSEWIIGGIQNVEAVQQNIV